MKLNYVTLNNVLREKAGDGLIFNQAVSIALGIAAGRAVPMCDPQEGVLSRDLYARGPTQAAVERIVSQFNEQIVVDVDLALAIARFTWIARAGMCYPSPIIDVTEGAMEGDPLLHLSGANAQISPQAWEFMKKNHVVLFSMANRISATMELFDSIASKGTDESRRRSR